MTFRARLFFIFTLALLLTVGWIAAGVSEVTRRAYDQLSSQYGNAMVAQFELVFLAELGFGLDLSSCAATGVKNDLIYVSPRSGRAVSRAAGEAYRDKLMRLPDFLRAEGESASAADVADAFALTGFFLDRYAFAPRGLPVPDARARFVAAVCRSA